MSDGVLKMRWYPLPGKDPELFVGHCDHDPVYVQVAPEGRALSAEEMAVFEALNRLDGWETAYDWALERFRGAIVFLTRSATAYAQEPEDVRTDRDPNHAFYSCGSCALDYHEHWRERWEEYYESRI